jgi:hypothetical protein
LTALLAMLDAGAPGGWRRLFTAPNVAKFDQPTVTGVDFPSLGLSRAVYDAAAGELHLRTYAATPADAGRPTTFRITRVAHPERLQVRCDGAAFAEWDVVAPDEVELRLDIGDHDLSVRC